MGNPIALPFAFVADTDSAPAADIPAFKRLPVATGAATHLYVTVRAGQEFAGQFNQVIRQKRADSLLLFGHG